MGEDIELVYKPSFAAVSSAFHTHGHQTKLSLKLHCLHDNLILKNDKKR